MDMRIILPAVMLALATMSSAAPAKASESTAATLTADDVNAWLDGYLPYALRQGDVAGAEVAIVKDGQVLTVRGYGYSDVAKGTPVDPKLTLFRIGSVSKLFTWTAVMQLVEQGKIDLDVDVNRYIDFKIPARDGQPVTMRNLMQHTGGFEEQAEGIISEDPNAPGFEAILKRWVPERVFAPGTTPAYSNYGATLAGYIVQRLSGEPFAEYVEQHIFAPLDMKYSTFRQPLPPSLAPLMSKGYELGSGPAHPFELVGPAPAGSMSSPAEDMAHFMIAHLRNGEYHGNRILRTETAETMHNSPLTLVPPLNRMELGFFETNVNGHEVIAHLGDTDYFHTDLHLFLEQGVGLYYSFNSAGNASDHLIKLRIALLDDFADRYFPSTEKDGRVDEATARSHAVLLAGRWVASRGSQSNFLAVVGLLGQTNISVDSKGELVWDFLGKPRHWVETAPFVWRDTASHERLAAKRVDGKVVAFNTDTTVFEMFLRAPWYQDSGWLLPLFCISVAMLLMTALSWPIAAIVRRQYRVKLALDTGALRAFRLSKISAILITVSLSYWALTLALMLGDEKNLAVKFDGLVRCAQIFGFIAFIGGFGLTLWNLYVVWTGNRRWPAKVWSVVLAISAFVVLWVAFVFKLLSFGLYY
jgi:CubicO group peptidase (beta-lactamase class C family)